MTSVGRLGMCCVDAGVGVVEEGRHRQLLRTLQKTMKRV